MEKIILDCLLSFVMTENSTAVSPDGWYGPYEVTSVSAGTNGVYFYKPTSL